MLDVREALKNNLSRLLVELYDLYWSGCGISLFISMTLIDSYEVLAF